MPRALLCQILKQLARVSYTLSVLCALLCPCRLRAEGAATRAAGPRMREPLRDAPASTGPSKALQWTGVGLGVLGTGALATGWAMSQRTDQLQDRLRLLEPGDPRVAATRASLDRARTVSVASSIAGGALSITALQLALPRVEGVPVWSYIVGAGGLALMGVGAYELATSGRCEQPTPDGDCLGGRKDSHDRGAFMLAMGAPLLTIPLTYAFRHLMPPERSKVGLKPQISGNAWSLKVQAKF